MITFTIEDIEYRIPERLTVKQWQELTKWDFEHEAHWPRILSTTTGAPLEYLELTKGDSLELGVAFIASILNARKEVELKDFNELNFGQWCDLDVYLNWGADKHIQGILDILAPEVKQADEALWVLERYATWRDWMYNQYRGLFDLDEPRESDGETVNVAKSWYHVIVVLAGEDLLKIDEVTEQPLKKTLNFMAWRKEQQLKEQERINKERRKNDILRHR
tara:strand:- start:815 stop:1474 length:660 start_codon:yes stop_codon:yes gene_type:complete